MSGELRTWPVIRQSRPGCSPNTGPRVVGVAYRLLGSLSDAEDVAQETWLRWAEVPLREVMNPRAYLVRIGTRLALNRLRQLSRAEGELRRAVVARTR